MSEQEQLKSIVQQINTGWLKSKFDSIEPFFHEDIVFSAPKFAKRLQGRTNCLQSYRDFMQKAKVNSYEESDHQVDMAASVGVVTYRYKIAWTSEEKESEESGHDMFVFVRSGQDWKAVWRTLIPDNSG